MTSEVEERRLTF